MEDIDNLLSKILEYRKKSLGSYILSLPKIAKERTTSPSRMKLISQEIILIIWLFCQRICIRRKLPKYVFLTMFFSDVMSTLPPKEVMVIGGRKELLFCLHNGYRFYWSGAIFYGFNLFIFSGKNNFFSAVIIFLRKSFLKEPNKRYLFLSNDSQPEGMTLSISLKSIPNLNIICIAHGMINGDPTRINEGESCKFNWVWNQSQKSSFKEDINHASFILGLPYEIHQVQSQCREVILVGHCGLSSSSIDYFYSLYSFSKIYQILEAAGIHVFYRPHPEDDIEYVQSIFSNVSLSKKNELLTSSRRIFIGFESSLIFEAQEFGNSTIGLNSIELNHYRAFDVDFEVSSGNFDDLPRLVFDIFENPRLTNSDNFENLKSRVTRCLRQVDAFNTSK
jgi:hypothetical protein